jgi:hypothetical protein
VERGREERQTRGRDRQERYETEPVINNVGRLGKGNKMQEAHLLLAE